MNRFRIGTDKRIQWRVKGASSLEGRMLALSLSVGFSKVFILNFTVSGNVVEFDYLGGDQKATGVVTLTLYENLGVRGMRAIDTAAFEIMAYSWMVGENTDPSGSISIFPIDDSGQVDPDSGGSSGIRSVEVSVDGSMGTPHCDSSLVNGVLYLAFSGLKGESANDFTDEYKNMLESALQSADLVPITEKIPAQASAQNKLADKAFVNSSIATAAAEFKGTFDSLAQLRQVAADNNDYGYVVSTDQAGNTVYGRYKYNGSEWLFEYNLNNSSFTASQWAAIQSQITEALVQKLSALPTNQALNQALSGKQDTISDLPAIRSGAAAGATAYQKPISGIPATDLAEGIIPTVPTDIVRHSAQSLTDAQKTQARNNIGAASEEELDAISRGEYVEAWDGASEPVVAEIPSGVQVEYNSQTYTGTLAASNDTLGKIYLVAIGTSNEYNRYRTSRSGVEGSYTYSWVPLGSTQMNLSGFATKNEVSQLQQEVTEIGGGAITIDSENPGGIESIYPDKQFDVDNAVGLPLSQVYTTNNTGFRNFRIPCEGASQITYNIFYSAYGYGCPFVDENDIVIASHYFETGASTPQTVPVPPSAKYFIWSIRPGDGKLCTVKYPSQIQKIQGGLSYKRGKISIIDGTIEVTASQNRLFSARLLSVEDFASVSAKNGYLVQLLYFDNALSYLGTSGFVTKYDSYNITPGSVKYILFYVKKSDESDFVDSYTDGVVVTFTAAQQKNLENISCCGLSLRELFIDLNMVTNPDLLGTFGWSEGFSRATRGFDLISPSFCRSIIASDSNSRRYQSLNLKEGHRYLVACEARITGVNSTIESSTNNVLNYSGGTLVNNRAMGIVLASVPFGVSHKSSEYEKVVSILEVPVTTSFGTIVAKNFNLGNGGVNNMIFGYARNAVCIDITDAQFTSRPTRKDLFNAFQKYCEYVKCARVADMNLSVSIDKETVFCDSDAKRAYMSEMNKIAEELGCTQTDLRNPSGVYYEDHKTTCRDYIKVGAMAMTENSFLRIINRHSMDVPVVHADGTSGFIVPTEIAEYSGASGEASAVLNTDYDIVSAKTGTWNGATNASKTQTLVMVVRSKATGKFIVGYIHNGGANYSTTWNDNKYNYMKNLFDKVEDDSVALSLGTTSEWSAGYIPTSTQWAKYVDFGTVKRSDTVQFPPASTTKYLTCMLALQHLKETEVVEYDILDFSTGSGADITAGDKFTVRDAVYLCMASSSNSLANMLARYTGKRLMEESNL